MKRAIDVEICRDRLTLSANCVVPRLDLKAAGQLKQKVASPSHKDLPKSHFMTSELYYEKLPNFANIVLNCTVFAPGQQLLDPIINHK